MTADAPQRDQSDLTIGTIFGSGYATLFGMAMTDGPIRVTAFSVDPAVWVALGGRSVASPQRNGLHRTVLLTSSPPEAFAFHKMAGVVRYEDDTAVPSPGMIVCFLNAAQHRLWGARQWPGVTRILPQRFALRTMSIRGEG